MNAIYDELYKIVMLVNPKISVDVDIDTNVDRNKVYSVGDMFSFYFGNGSVECILFMTKYPVDELGKYCQIHDMEGFYVHIIFDHDQNVSRDVLKLIATHSILIRLYARTFENESY